MEVPPVEVILPLIDEWAVCGIYLALVNTSFSGGDKEHYAQWLNQWYRHLQNFAKSSRLRRRINAQLERSGGGGRTNRVGKRAERGQRIRAEIAHLLPELESRAHAAHKKFVQRQATFTFEWRKQIKPPNLVAAHDVFEMEKGIRVNMFKSCFGLINTEISDTLG